MVICQPINRLFAVISYIFHKHLLSYIKKKKDRSKQVCFSPIPHELRFESADGLLGIAGIDAQPQLRRDILRNFGQNRSIQSVRKQHAVGVLLLSSSALHLVELSLLAFQELHKRVFDVSLLTFDFCIVLSLAGFGDAFKHLLDGFLHESSSCSEKNFCKPNPRQLSLWSEKRLFFQRAYRTIITHFT